MTENFVGLCHKCEHSMLFQHYSGSADQNAPAEASHWTIRCTNCDCGELITIFDDSTDEKLWAYHGLQRSFSKLFELVSRDPGVYDVAIELQEHAFNLINAYQRELNKGETPVVPTIPGREYD